MTKFSNIYSHSSNGKTLEVYRCGTNFIQLSRDTASEVAVSLFTPFNDALNDDPAAITAIDSLYDEMIAAQPERLEAYRTNKAKPPDYAKYNVGGTRDYSAFFVQRGLFLSNYQANTVRLTELVMRKLNASEERNEKQAE